MLLFLMEAPLDETNYSQSASLVVPLRGGVVPPTAGGTDSSLYYRREEGLLGLATPEGVLAQQQILQ